MNLKPCPFCGGDVYLSREKRCYRNGYDHCIICHDCGVCTPDFGASDEAVEVWNQRVLEADHPTPAANEPKGVAGEGGDGTAEKGEAA